jgi:formylglycine-generating enzyme required for sulfatase activity
MNKLLLISAILMLICLAASAGTVLKGQTPAEIPFESFEEKIPGTNREFEMIPVAGTIFLMGNRHPVSVDSFWMSSNVITWNLYNLFVEESIENVRSDFYRVYYNVDISADAVSSPTLTDEILEMLLEAEIPADVISIPSPSYGDLSGGMGTDGYPAVNMTHYAAHMFTRWLTIKTGKFYRLPTEAEWELACRAGETGEYTPSKDVDGFAWHRGNSNRSYQPVGSKQPNEYGFHDMLGNVSELTLDQYHEDYFERLEDEPSDNPWFRPDRIYPHSVRGGSWMDTADASNCLQRQGTSPNWKRNDPQLPKSLWWFTNAPFVGFRVVMPLNQPEGVDEMEEYWIDAIQDYN